MQHAETAARELGLIELRLFTNARMTKNVSLYTHWGFRRTHDSQHGQFTIVHMASHGVFDEDAKKTFVLTHDAHLNLQGLEALMEPSKFRNRPVELLTLSACQTALGKEAGGEGYLGFTQALFLAGARSCVLSLWQVDDTATALLMTRFYQNLLGKRDGPKQPLAKAEALREAKQWLRNLNDKEIEQEVARLPQPRGKERTRPLASARSAHPFAHPYYWSAFILIGDPE